MLDAVVITARASSQETLTETLVFGLMRKNESPLVVLEAVNGRNKSPYIVVWKEVSYRAVRNQIYGWGLYLTESTLLS